MLKMIAIEDKDFNSFAWLFDNYGANQAVIDATLSGFNPGWLWVDNRDPSKNCLLITRYGFAFGWGKSIGQFTQQKASEMKKVLTFVPKAAELGGIGIPIQRLEFLGPNKISSWRVPPESAYEGLELVSIDAKNFEKSNWKEALLQVFADAIAFEKSGGGVALTNGQELVAEALIGFVGRKYIDIGTVTHPAHRGNGYSTLVCSELIKRINARGLYACWSCNADNYSSVKVAEKLAFETRKIHTVFQITPK